VNDLHEILIRHYVHSSSSGKLFISMSYDPRACSGGNDDGNDADGCHVTARGHTPKCERGGDLDIICAAAMSRHWGTRLLRLKWGNDATEYRSVLPHILRLAEETGMRLKWGDPELTRFLAVEALHAWLLDRRIHGRGEWAQRCVTLRKRIDVESQKVAAEIAKRLVL